MTTSIAIRTIKNETPDVLRIVTDKPDGYGSKPGQACKVRLDKSGMQEDARPFTFVSENHAQHDADRYYLCGPPNMVNTIRELGVPEQRIVADL